MEDHLLQVRLQKIDELRQAGVNPYANGFAPTHTTQDVAETCADKSTEEVAACESVFRIAGRVVGMRDFGKSAFFHLQDRKGRIQAYVQKSRLGEEQFATFKKVDTGDFLGIEGRAFLTKTGELTVLADSLVMLTKSLRPLPEKWHGLQDVETRYRQRYLDLIANEDVRATFLTRAKIITLVRQFLLGKDFVEVETPMMHPIAGGATALPFKTHHNALDIDLYLRIAPELYLKRLLVGGIERVFEINRNFRNEGISTQHNPEFTMVEFYHAYATYEDLMNLTQEMFCSICKALNGTYTTMYQGAEIDFTPPWKRLTIKEAAAQYGNIAPVDLEDLEKTRAHAQRLGIELAGHESLGEIITTIFEGAAEKHLLQPTFITQYPVEVSPLARKNEQDPTITDRFELFITGREIANAFSELNDPVDQRQRLAAQVAAKEKIEGGPVEMDEDFLLALEHGMPPAAGQGIGIDRLVMLFTDSASIRDVILFPLFRSDRAQKST